MKFTSCALFGFLAVGQTWGFAPYTPVSNGPTSSAVTSKTSSSSLAMVDYPKPNVENTNNYREMNALSSTFKNQLKIDDSATNGSSQKKKVAIIGGGLSGLACAKYLSDAGNEIKGGKFTW